MVEVTGGCPVLRLTSSFVTWAVYGIGQYTKTTEQHLIVRSGKSEAQVGLTII